MLEEFLPPMLAHSEIDRILLEVITANEIKATADEQMKGRMNAVVGKVFKPFYERVDRTTVDAGYVRQKAEEILKGQQ